MNFQIRVPQVHIIGPKGESLGMFATQAAIKMAQDEGLDLVEVAPQAKPPVCKIIDYGKFKYQQQKKQQESKKHQTVINLKEIKIRPNISEHDLLTKVRHIRRFLEEKDKVKVLVQFRGREVTHAERGKEIIDRVIKETTDVGTVDSSPKMEWKNLLMILAPK